MTRTAFAASAAALIALTGASGAGALMIDSFDAGSLIFVPASTTTDNQVLGAMIGGERDESITNSAPSGGIVAGVSGGAYSYGAINATGTALLAWDGADASPTLDPTGLGGIDFTVGGTQSGFSIEILSNDFVASLVLTVYTSAGDFSQITVMTPGGIPSGPSQEILISFGDLVPTGAGVDFANVGAVTLLIDGTVEPQLDLTLGSIQTTAMVVPEPATFSQLLFGLVLLAGANRRYRSAV